jgi:hypothetical protein
MRVAESHGERSHFSTSARRRFSLAACNLGLRLELHVGDFQLVGASWTRSCCGACRSASACGSVMLSKTVK